jgi:hypothetical protein
LITIWKAKLCLLLDDVKNAIGDLEIALYRKPVSRNAATPAVAVGATTGVEKDFSTLPPVHSQSGTAGTSASGTVSGADDTGINAAGPVTSREEQIEAWKAVIDSRLHNYLGTIYAQHQLNFAQAMHHYSASIMYVLPQSFRVCAY